MTRGCSPRDAILLMLAVFVMAPECRAGRPFQTIDADIVPPGTCQLEAGARSGRGDADLELRPACNVGGPVEWALPLVVSKPDQEPASRLAGVEAKIALKPLGEDRWGWGIVAGMMADVTKRPRSDGAYAHVIASIVPVPGWVTHLNAGAARDRGATRQPTWAAALEHAPTPAVIVGVETFGTRGTRPFVQLGTRVRLDETLSIDVAVGGQRGGADRARFLTIGLTLSGSSPRVLASSWGR